MNPVFIPVEALWVWVDIGAYIKAVVAEQRAVIQRVIQESAWDLFPYPETHSMGLFQQTVSRW